MPSAILERPSHQPFNHLLALNLNPGSLTMDKVIESNPACIKARQKKSGKSTPRNPFWREE
jgi:hypothetical protein